MHDGFSKLPGFRAIKAGRT